MRGGESMKNHKRISTIFTGVIILSLILVGSAAAKSDNQTAVCHSNGNGSFELLYLNGNKLQTHLSHGDASPGAAVPGQAGMVFGADCSVTSAAQYQPAGPKTNSSTTNNGKKAEKVFVCHKRGNGTFIMININGNALPAHLLHGDGLPEGFVPNHTDQKFSATCSVVEQKQLMETLTVDSNVDTKADPVVSETVLASTEQYEIEVSGTYIFDLDLNLADGEYVKLGANPWMKGDGYYVPPNLLDLSIDDCLLNRDWGAFNTGHVYTMAWQGEGQPLSFCINDLQYTDNHGALTVKIFKINW